MAADTDLERQFHREMIRVYERARDKCGYNATRFLNMVNEHGGLPAAQLLLGSRGVSSGYVQLWQRGRLDISMEALVLQPDWRSLFSDCQLSIAGDRLKSLGFEVS